MRLMTLLLIGLLAAVPTLAQEETCTPYIGQVLVNVNRVCQTMAIDQVCLVNPEVTGSAALSEPGAVISLNDVDTLTLAPLDPAAATWGVIVVRTETYTVVVFGGAVYTPADGSFTVDDTSACAAVTPQMIIQAVAPTTVPINGVEIDISGTMAVQIDGEDVTALPVVAASGSIDEDSAGAEPLAADEAAAGGDEMAWVTMFAAPFVSDIPYPVTPSSPIVPDSGEWALTQYTTDFYTDCQNSGESEQILPMDPVWLATFDFSGGVSIPAFVEQQTGRPLPAEVMDNADFIEPAPNVYRVIDRQTSPPIEFSLYIVSPTEIVTSTFYWVELSPILCGVLTFNFWEYQG